MKILLTGSTGFLGTFIRNRTSLQKTNFIFGSTSDCHSNHDLVRFQSLYQEAEKLIKDDLFAIIHCAAIIPSSFSAATYEEVFLPNIQMMENLCQLAFQKHIRKFIYISSFGSMQTPEQLDIRDYYTLVKITGELYCRMQEAHGIQTASLRISSPFGEWQHQRTVVRIFVEQALKNEPLEVYGTGSREQNFTYAGDVLAAIEAVVKAPKISGVYNIVGPESISMLKLAQTIVNISGSSAPIVCGRQPDPQELYRPEYNYTRAKRELDYSPCSLEKGLTQYIAWIKKQQQGILHETVSRC
ncbi:putative UDP-glucose 4-epimerase [Candidatus Vecturithrix granuli]|uniref:Putative UDP-glucose 4-epimerase n=1 Tax=Vecturithrix granuli TaxID=1499967 RepID=A0A081C7V9_VECG1|nr:putative UDP-glucose 4-epimerase [Candidatus Vecturithrix granuli]